MLQEQELQLGINEKQSTAEDNRNHPGRGVNGITRRKQEARTHRACLKNNNSGILAPSSKIHTVLLTNFSLLIMIIFFLLKCRLHAKLYGSLLSK